ncbi:cobalamin B12-binding domain-containing protein [Catellatospora bangladeshensis]|uniref:Cobalamin-binding protein n=1 Tax=Catellatospora bangladeshensis TaxID=310355 RepID=A0A8J3JLD7_9ACTN|nr:cobalamin-dependent protein [Catellatospora bangladeshensis]GIF82763.1 cobalamin-binding protein [Catellatospora bangladeshensis]
MTTAVSEADRAGYLALVGQGAQAPAVDFALALAERGVPPRDVLLDLVAPTQAAIGDLWARNEWSVAQEHAATHVSEHVVAALAAHHRPGAAERGILVVACVDGEWHALPARLFAEVVRWDGWDVRFLGASVPGPHLISYLHRHGPDVVAVSCSVPTRLAAAHRVIEAAQSTATPVLAGGRGFGPAARWGRTLGADRVAGDAREALGVLRSWPGLSLAESEPRRESFVSDDEHVLIAKRGPQLVASGMEALAERFPVVGRYTPAQREATEFDLGQIVEFLCAGLLVDDPELFGTFLDWLCVVLGTRRVPLPTVDLVLDVYQQQLYDFPRARAHLAAGHRRLAG